MRTFALSTAVTALTLALATGANLQLVSLIPAAAAQNSNASQNLTMPQLQALVAPIALYPDSLLGQCLMAATYPLEVAEAANWQRTNANLKGQQLEDALKAQTWDNSVKSLISFPTALGQLSNQLSWTQKLGDAYLAQPKDLMQAVQNLRAKAQRAGNLQSGEQIQVSTTPQQEIVIVPSNPQVVYVPTYNPTVIYGAWPYPAYPPYPPYYAPGYNPAAVGLMSFGLGMAVGAALWSTPHWGSGSITINNNQFNNFNRNYNNLQNRAPERFGNDSNWGYNPAHRDGVPYSNQSLANRYGGESAGQQARNQYDRQQQAKSAWDQNATPQDKQDAQNARNNAQKDWNNATPQQRQNAQNAWNRDASPEQKARVDADRDRNDGGDRFGGDRFGGGRMGGGFGGGHFGGGFRR
jgi:hypothetical protein